MAKTLLILIGVIIVICAAIYAFVALLTVLRDHFDADRVATRNAKNEALDATADLEAAIRRAERKKTK